MEELMRTVSYFVQNMRRGVQKNWLFGTISVVPQPPYPSATTAATATGGTAASAGSIFRDIDRSHSQLSGLFRVTD